jgi:hypothetical protein
MARLAATACVFVAAWLRASVPAHAATGDASPSSAPLLACLEPIARTFHVRIVDHTGLTTAVPCAPSPLQLSLEQAMDRLLQPLGLNWRRLDDGTLEVIAAHAPSSMKLPPLDIEGEPVAEAQRPYNPVATPLVERATATTSLDKRWLETAPLLGFNQLSWYAPNVYGSGQSLAIRGTERDTDFFPALTVTFDGIELGTRLLDDELVPLQDVTNLTLARGPRTFESGEGSQAGAISLKTAAPTPEATESATLGAGNDGARNGAASWSGPLGTTDFGATIALDSHELPSFVRQVVVPKANIEKRDNYFGRIKLRYAPDSPLTAELAALGLSGDSSDRQVVVPTPAQLKHTSFDLFDRDSYAKDPVVAQTHARGAAGFVRYDKPDRWAIDAHASLTTISRDATELPFDTRWSDYELRRRLGLTASEHPAQDWTVVEGLEHDNMTTSFYTPVYAQQLSFSHFALSTESALLWAEHSWSSAWNIGLGIRWLHEESTAFASNVYRDTYRVPIPLSVVEWHPWVDQEFALSYGTGYRSGGNVDSTTTYPAERSQNLEFSWRAKWLGGSLHTTFSAFDGKIRDRFTYALSVYGAPLLARVRDRGLEFELTADLSDHWLLRAGVGSLSSRYSSYVYHYGDPTSQAPPQTSTFGIRYGRTQGWYGAADAYHAAAATYYNPDARLPAYDALSVRAGYRTRQWDAALVATNAFDAHFIERVQYSTANQFGYRLGDPRRIELLVKRTW